MEAFNRFLEKYVRFLWVVTAFLAYIAIAPTANYSFNFIALYIFIIGILNVLATYGLFRKLSWGWKAAAYAAILSILYLAVYFIWVGVVINLLVLYTAVKFKHQLGGKSGDSLLPTPLQKYLP